MTENLKGKMGHKMNHFNVGKGHPIEEVKIILHCINFNIPCHKALNANTLSTTFNFVKKYTFFHLVLCPHLPPTKSNDMDCWSPLITVDHSWSPDQSSIVFKRARCKKWSAVMFELQARSQGKPIKPNLVPRGPFRQAPSLTKRIAASGNEIGSNRFEYWAVQLK